MAMKRKKRNTAAGAKLEMTPMIDVVFQLLIFFLVTLKEQDILSRLDVSRPAPDPNSTPEEQIQDMLDITVYNEGFVIKGRKYNRNELDRHISKLASFSDNVSVIIRCTGDSPHQYLVQLLDICAKNGLTNLSVFSL